MASRFGIGTAPILTALQKLEQAGRVVQGELRPGGSGLEWCDSGVLRAIRQKSLARLRDLGTPVQVGDLATLRRGFLKGLRQMLGSVIESQEAEAVGSLLKGSGAAERERPIRVAIIEQCTYDGTIYNARKIVEKIGHLCEYIHFDEAWAGFVAFHPLLKDHFSMGLGLTERDPGIIATQSTHKQLAGFSQASQIHVRDAHIRGRPYRVNHKRFNEMVMLQVSTSPFYPLFSSLDVNAQMHRDKAGHALWDDMIKLGIEARKAVRKRFGGFLDPFVPDMVEFEGRSVRWEDVPTDELARDQRYWKLDPNAAWHGYRNVGPDLAMVDPTKLMLTTPGIDHASGDYHAFLWQNGRMTDLGTLGGTSSESHGINAQGEVVGSASTASGERHPFLWKHGTMEDLGFSERGDASPPIAKSCSRGWAKTGVSGTGGAMANGRRPTTIT